MRRQRPEDHVLYGIVAGLEAIAKRLSLESGRRLGRAIGTLGYLVDARDRRRADANLQRALPALSQRERRSIVRSMFRHLGESLFEIFWIGHDWEKFDGLTTIGGADVLRDALSEGKGVLLFTSHAGNWEWLGAAIARAGFPLTAMARDIDNEKLNRFIVRTRERFGVKSIGRGSESSGRDLLRAFRSGNVIAALIDQNIRTVGAEVPFFGMPAFTPTGPARLALRSGAVPVVALIRREDGVQRIHIERLQVAGDADEVELTARATTMIEEWIREAPEQWVWIHARWRVPRVEIRQKKTGAT